jgi:hypothetical protein
MWPLKGLRPKPVMGLSISSFVGSMDLSSFVAFVLPPYAGGGAYVSFLDLAAMTICREVIAQLDKAQEEWLLEDAERDLIHLLKMRLLDLAAIEKGIIRQKSRVTWLKKGGANTKFFHIMANNKRRKNFIHSLQTENGLVTTQQAKHEAIYSHFLNHIGTSVPRSCSLNFT